MRYRWRQWATWTLKIFNRSLASFKTRLPCICLCCTRGFGQKIFLMHFINLRNCVLKIRTTLCTFCPFRATISLGYNVGRTRSAVTRVNVSWHRNAFFYNDVHRTNLQQIISAVHSGTLCPASAPRDQFRKFWLAPLIHRYWLCLPSDLFIMGYMK